MLSEKKSTEDYIQCFVLEKQKNVNTHVFTSAKRNTGQIKTEANNSNNRNIICGGGQETGERIRMGNKTSQNIQ